MILDLFYNQFRQAVDPIGHLCRWPNVQKTTDYYSARLSHNDISRFWVELLAGGELSRARLVRENGLDVTFTQSGFVIGDDLLLEL
jgi:hypothetical protein